jgi:hypothetical protein
MGTFPNHVQISVVRPLHRNSHKTNMSNYRPVSLLTTFSEVSANVMYNRMSHYLEANNVLVPEQFGVRKGISAENADFKLTDCIQKSLNQKMCVRGIFCDLTKTCKP